MAFIINLLHNVVEKKSKTLKNFEFVVNIVE